MITGELWLYLPQQETKITHSDEWLSSSEVGLDDTQEANQDLTNWLIEYSFNHPHETLDYQAPIEYASQ